MNKIGLTKFQNILNVLSSRVALNIYFWVLMLLIKMPDADDQTAYPKLFYYGMMVLYLSFFAVLAYVNNLVLMPKFFFKGKRLLYVLLAIVMVFVVSYAYTFFMKYMSVVFPGFDTMQTSIVMSPVSNDMSFDGVMNDIDTYFNLMIIWVLVFSLLGYYHHNSAKVKAMQQLISSHQEAELNFLKNQLNPHFLFNTLNNLYALTLKKSDEAPEAILKLSSVLRYVLYEADTRLVLFDQEKEIIQAYIDIEMLRIQDSPQIQFSITSDQSYLVPPLIWLPILENVFKHTRVVSDMEINFQLSIQNNKLRMFAKNNFAPASKTANNEKGGIGLDNLKKRLALLYPNQFHINQLVEDNYFSIEVTIDKLS